MQYNPSNGIAFFYSEHCKTCSHQRQLFGKIFKPTDYELVCCDNDPEYFIREHGVDLIPVIRIYKDSKIEWEHIDLLHEEHVEYLIEYVRTHNN